MVMSALIMAILVLVKVVLVSLLAVMLVLLLGVYSVTNYRKQLLCYVRGVSDNALFHFH